MQKHILRIKCSLVFLLLLAGGFSCSEEKTKALPYLGNYDIEYKLVDGVEVTDTIYPTIPYFYFRNQDSNTITSKDLKGKIWISDFFFTTCSTICPGMTKMMKELNENTRDIKDHVQFISFTINPKYDQPSVLKNYMEYYKLNNDNWVFLTGDEEETHRLGIENFLIVAEEDLESADGFAHSEAFTLVDKSGYIRGVYDMSVKGQVKQLEKDLRKLLKEEYGVE